MVIMLSIREVRDSLEASAIYFSENCHNKEDAQECYEALKAMARYRQSVEDARNPEPVNIKLQGGAMAAQEAHNLPVAGSIPAPAILPEQLFS